MESWTYFLEVENSENLRKVVLEDLKLLGVNTKYLKKKYKEDSFVAQPNANVFGNFLDFVPSVYVEGCGPVPRVLAEIGSIIERNIVTEGLFRKSGSVSRKKELMNRIELGGSLEGANIYDVTGILKTFLRQLPVSLLAPSQAILTAFEQAHEDGENERRIDALQLLVLLLPAANICTLRFLLLLLSKVADHSDQNKMDVSNLALCLGPNLFPSVSQTKADAKTLQVHTSIVQLLMLHASYIGMISNGTCAKIASPMSILSDNELDRSCVDVEDTSQRRGRDKKKKKKKRRSSSLQGLVETLSSSFTRRRRSRSHNSSTISDKSSIYVKSAVKSSESLCSMNPVEGQTPKMKQKRKADNQAFSVTKKRAILENMPQKSLLTTSNQFTPSMSVDLKFANDSSIIFSATLDETSNTPKRRDSMRTPNKMKSYPSARSGCFSPKSKTVKKKKSSFMAFVRRLSGSRESSPIRVPEQDCSVELSKTFDDGDKDTSELNFIQSPIEPMDHDANMSRQISTNSLNKAFISDDDFVLDEGGSITSEQSETDGHESQKRTSSLSLNSRISTSTAVSSIMNDAHSEEPDECDKVESLESLDSAICMNIINGGESVESPSTPSKINEEDENSEDAKTPCPMNIEEEDEDDENTPQIHIPSEATPQMSRRLRALAVKQQRRHTLNDPTFHLTSEARSILARAGVAPHRTIKKFPNNGGVVAAKVQQIEEKGEKGETERFSKRNASPVRIPTIFAKNHDDMVKYKEKINRIRSPKLPVSCKLPKEVENRALSHSSKVTVSAPIIKPSLGNFDVNLIRKRNKNAKDEKEFVV